MSLVPLPSTKGHSDSDALQSAQRAPELLERYSGLTKSSSVPFISTAESSEIWAAYEKLIYSCLRIGDDSSAQSCVERLTKRFGESNERVMGLYGMFQEAVADDDAALADVLKEYGRILAEDPTNMPVTKRRIALLQSLGRQSEAIGALTEMLEISPTDAEAWTELSALYLSQTMFSQASFCLEEVLLIYPNAWNIHARLGEILFISSFSPGNANDTSIERALTEGIHRYCRSIELCDGYLRGYYGLKISTDRLLETCYSDGNAIARAGTDNGVSARLPLRIVQELNRKATLMIENIVSRRTAGCVEYGGYEESEIIAAKALLDRQSPDKTS